MTEPPPAPAASVVSRHAGSLRGQLLRWLLLPLTALVIFNAINVYRNALDAADLAYDRTLLASSRAIAEEMHVQGARIVVDVPYAALDIFEGDTPGRLYHKVTGTQGEFISGYDDFPSVPAGTPRSDTYPALVHFYSATYRGEPLRIAALYQPVADGAVQGMALIQVGETLDARRLFTRLILLEALWPQAALVAAVALLAWFAVRAALRPLRELADDVEQRPPTDLSEFNPERVHKEVQPLVTAINHYTGRLQALVNTQRRFIADASHQLRTPLSVLKTQLGLGLRQPSIDPATRDMLTAAQATVDRATRLANQLLSRARTEQGIAMRRVVDVELVEVLKQSCLDIAEAAVAKGVDLSFEGAARAEVKGDPVLLQELIVNILDNAIRCTPQGGQVRVSVHDRQDVTGFTVEDSGPGIPAAEREQVFQPFYRGTGARAAQSGTSGLGLSIAREIAQAHGAEIVLDDSPAGGLSVTVRFASRC